MPQKFKVVDHDNDNEKTFSSRSQAEEKADIMRNDFHADVSVEPVKEQEADTGGTQVEEQETREQPTQPVQEDVTEQLPDEGPSVDEDPLVWMPDEFTDTVDGTVSINRKGYEVIAHHYDIQCDTDMVVSPLESDYEVVIHKAVATDSDGDTYSAYGEAHTSDVDTDVMVRMSCTRAYKRAVSRASGVGMVAVEELQGSL